MKNESDEYFIIINNVLGRSMDTVQGSVSNTGFKDNTGYIQVINKINVNNYKTGMIVFIGLFFALVILFTVGSIRNKTEEFFLIVNDINNNLIYPFYGSIKNTKFINKNVLGYIRVEKYPKSYKTLMIVFTCLFIFMILMFSVLFITGYITIHTSTVQY